MIVLFTDFGRKGPYIGQMQAVLARAAPDVAVIDLLADAPAFNPRAAAYLLPAFIDEFPDGTVFLGVVDPGVGMGGRDPVVLEADGRFFVGPGNGLFELIARRASQRCWWRIAWRPENVSASFHGRDLFAPVAARLAAGDRSGLEPIKGDTTGAGWPDDLGEVIYIDGYGNAMTGIRGDSACSTAGMEVAGRTLEYRRTFGEAPAGSAFWYINSIGLVEIAVNQGSAARELGLGIGSPVGVTPQVSAGDGG